MPAAMQPLLGNGSSPTPIRSGYLANIASMLAIAAICCGLAFAGFIPRYMERFSTTNLESRQNFHALFLESPSNDTLASHLFNLTQKPHIAGTAENMETAKYVFDNMKAYGMENVRYEDYPVFLSYPIKRELTITSPFHLKLAMEEAAYPQDPYSSDKRVSDLFLAYSPSGRLLAEVVFANYGRTEDFEMLAQLGVSCEGKIVIVRYGEIYRGDKVENSALNGAVATIIYSDPEEVAPEGTDAAHVYPNTRWLPPTGAQRGSIYPLAGDPETPGWPSTPDGERLPPNDPRKGMPAIPAMPLSYQDATPILEGLRGKRMPTEWEGGLKRDHYELGPGPVVVDFRLEMNNTVETIRNVIATVEGVEEPERYVVLGNHRDAWTFGAADPNSGTTCLLAGYLMRDVLKPCGLVCRGLFVRQLAEGFGSLLKAGWRPRRTIVLASWDAEEYGLIGSTEWVETNEDLLSSRAVAYINVDTSVAGPEFLAEATPQLDSLIMEVTAQVPDPEGKFETVYDSWRAQNKWKDAVEASNGPQVGRLGGGSSDYGPFLQHLGVSSINIQYGTDYPMYHSKYDNFHWMAKFGDPGFHRHRAIAQIWGLITLRLVDSVLLPFDYKHYARVLEGYAGVVDTSMATAVLGRGEARSGGGDVDASPIHAAIDRFAAASHIATLAAQPLRTPVNNHSPPSLAIIHSLNERFLLAERAFLDPDGLGGIRSWYRHMVFAPAMDDNYGSVAFPGITDAIAFYAKGKVGASVDVVQHEIYRVARAIDRAARVLKGRLT